MDARTDTPELSEEAATRSLIDNAELRSILTHLSHELCRPLISLRAGFDLLLGDSSRPITEDQRGHVQTMVVLCDDLLRLTQSYLDYAGLVQGTRPLSFGHYTVGAMIRDIDRQFAATAASRRIDWDCAIEGGDTAVVTDASRCQQIFGNLVANALKYTPEGGEVRVSGRLDDPYWVITVADNGPGIPAEDVDRVFEPFYRLPRHESSKVCGNGLGLAICREMVDQLGGEIALHSGSNQGTRVTVRFPIDATEKAATTARRRK
jgi:signal transduction histidine kinase